jgi:hypothetical protein
VHSMLAIIALAAAGAGAQAAPSETLAEGAFGWMRELAGHCWTGIYPDGATSDRQCYSSQYGRYLRGTIEIAGGNGERAPYRGDSVFAWDPAAGEMKFYYWGSGGNHGTSVGRVDGDSIYFPNPPSADPNAPPTRTRWTRMDAHSFRVTMEAEVDGQWVDRMAVTYRRVDDRPPGQSR